MFNKLGSIDPGIVTSALKVFNFKPPYVSELSNHSQLDCRCGNKLTEVYQAINPDKYALFICGPAPRVKTRRKRKVALKKYRRKLKLAKLGALMASAMWHRPYYFCEKCGTRMGFYEAIGRNLIKIEPMRSGADPIYFPDEVK